MINGNLKQRALRTLNLENENKQRINLKPKSNLSNNIPVDIKLIPTKQNNTQKKLFKEAKHRNVEYVNQTKEVSHFSLEEITNTDAYNKGQKTDTQRINLEFMNFQNMLKKINL